MIATKGGITRSEGEQWGRDGSLPYLRSAVEKSLRALGVDVIDLYQWHRPDRSMVYADVIENFKTLQDEGKIKAIGISNANVEEIEIAVQVLGDGGLVSVQNEFSPKFRCSEDELEYCAERGIAFLPVEPAGRHRRRRPQRRRAVRRLRRDRPRPRRQPAAGGAGLGAVARRARHPHPRRPAAGVDHRLGQGGRPAAERRGAGALQRDRREPMSGPAASSDVVIVGGGHNGLVAAAYLARAGRSVTVLEARSELGGAVASARVFPGVDARLSRFSYLVSLLPETIVDELGLDLELRSRAVRSYTPVGDTGVLVRRSGELGVVTGHGADRVRRGGRADPDRAAAARRRSARPGSTPRCGGRWSSGRSAS